MDKLYIGDIPSDYKYAQFSGDYITLFNKPYGQNEILNYYRVYDKEGFYYSQGTQTFGNYNTTYFTEIPVTNDWLYRTDCEDIFLVAFIIIIMFVFLFNISTSCFKKGGIFSGLI